MRHHGFLALALAGTAAATCWLLHDNDQLDASEDRTSSFREVFSRGDAQAAPEQDPDGVRLNYFDAGWQRVLRDVAQQAELSLVMDKIPSGRFARRDKTRYSVESALNILNTELEPQGFRLILQNNFLIVLQLEKARTRYARPTVPETPSSAYPQPGSRRERASESPVDRAAAGNPFHPASRRSDDSSSLTPWTRVAQQDDVPAPGDVRRDYEPTGEREFSETLTRPRNQGAQSAIDNGPAVVRTVQVRHLKAAELARSIYLVYETRAELVKDGLQGLPTVVVNPANVNVQNVRPVFRIGIDQSSNELLLEASEGRIGHLVRLVNELDQPLDEESGETVELMPASVVDEATAAQLNEQLHRLVALQGQQNGRPQNDDPNAPADQNEDLPGDSINLRGDVTIQAIPEIGGLLIRGNQADVAQIRELINQLEEMSQGSLPGIHLEELHHVNSEAMSELLTSVYDRLAELRQRGTTERKTVAFFPVVQPNSILILAPKIELDNILENIHLLDKEVDPQSEFRVFPLKHAIASQVLTALDTLYETAEGRGLRTRIQSIADVRTNSVIVQGSPADLDKVADLIAKIDLDAPGKVHRVQIFQLNHATATELADVINQAIQSVSSPPQTTTGGAGGFGGFGGGTNQAPQELRDGTSVALEFLTSDGDTERLVKSGILADVRITADPRMNTLVVSAPQASMMLLSALIAELDGAPSATASIKVFTLKNADATQSVELLTSLFENQNQEEQLGVQIAGAEDATNSLIPLQFSADVRSNTVLAVGSEEALGVVEAILLRLDSDDSRQRQTSVIQLRNAPAELVSASIQNFLTQQQALQTSTEDLISNIERIRQEVVIAPDTNSNSLIVSASPDYYSKITDIIEELDATPPQVVIQALIVEVTLDNTDEFGVELGFQDPLLYSRGVVGDLITTTVTSTPVGQPQTTSQTIVSSTRTPGFNFNNTSAPLGNNGQVASTRTIGTQGLSNFSLGRQNNDLGFGGFVFSAQSDAVSVLMRALAARRTVHVLSRPMIRTTHNNIARMEVGQQVPVVNGVTQTVTAVTPQITPQRIGIILEVTPRITPDGSVAMEVYAEKSALASGSVPVFTDLTTGNTVDSVIINLAIADTTVNVPNGQTIVIGGMITKTDETLERKVPWLGDLPIVGRAFRYDGTNTARTELLIFLTPRIVFGDVDSELIKQIESERIHFIESEAEEIHGPLYSVPPSGLQQYQQLPSESYGVPGEIYPSQGITPTDEPYLPAPGMEDYPPQSNRRNRGSEPMPTLDSLSVRRGQRSAAQLHETAEPIIRPATATRQLAEGASPEKATRSISFSSDDAEFEEEADPDDAARESWMQKMLKRRK
ncbi:MAG: secretin N-terminal domain-containing protein [Planctomycetaceae bacterium]